MCSKYTQFLNLGSFVSDENPPIASTKFSEKAPQKAGSLHTMSMWEPREKIT